MDWNFKVYGEKGKDIIILHGLFGSLDNWQTIAKELSNMYKVWVPDQSNHGRSPHTSDISYALMSEDLLGFMNQQGIEKASIIGHSMGGKVAMTFALNYPERLETLIVADIGPVTYKGDHLPLFEAMMDLPLKEIAERTDADAILSKRIKSLTIRQFLLKNLGRDTDGFYWKPNLALLYKKYEDLMGFETQGKIFNGAVVFLKGSKSDYIQTKDFSFYQSIFPKAQLMIIPDAGHWLHAEQPKAFVDATREILGA